LKQVNEANENSGVLNPGVSGNLNVESESNSESKSESNSEDNVESELQKSGIEDKQIFDDFFK
jgi:hypothetical protein